MKKMVLISLLLVIPAVAFLIYISTFDIPFLALGVIGWVFGWTVADMAFKLSNVTQCQTK